VAARFVVDDAIVVVENVESNLSLECRRARAAHKTMDEVGQVRLLRALEIAPSLSPRRYSWYSGSSFGSRRGTITGFHTDLVLVS